MAIWVNLALAIASQVASALLRDRPDVEDAKPAGDGDFRFPRNDQGAPWGILYGTVRLRAPNLLWWDDKKVQAIESNDVVVGFKYRLGMQLGLCLGGEWPVDAIRRVWVEEDKLVYDGGGGDPLVTAASPVFTVNRQKLFGGDDLGQGGVNVTWRFFNGATNQAPSTYLAPFQTENGQQVTYRRKCYLAPDQQRGYFGNTSTFKPWSFETTRIPNPLGLADPTVNGVDANPMNVLYHAITSGEHPVDIPEALVDADNFRAAAETLRIEGNGFSMLIDRVEKVSELIARIEDQVDGYLDIDKSVGLYRFTLARADYNPDTIPEISFANGLLEIPEFTRGSWARTTNEITVKFVSRDDEYVETTTPPVHDPANIENQGGRRLAASFTMPGVKDAGLASKIATRKLRTRSTPFASGSIICDRSVFGVTTGAVRALTVEDLGITRLPIRITSIDEGTLQAGRIRLDFVQDVFAAVPATVGPAQPSLWVPPVDGLVPYPSGQQLAFEAPRALVARSGAASASTPLVYANARAQGVEVRFLLNRRTNAGSATFTGTPTVFGSSFGFSLLGTLAAPLGVGSAYPFDGLSITPSPDSEAEILDAFPAGLDPTQVGTDLTTLLMIGDEFLLVSGTASAAGLAVDVDGVWRGALDSVQAAHDVGAPVFILHPGGTLSESPVTDGDFVEVRLTAESSTALVDPLDVGVTPVVFQMDSRGRRPYPPSELSLNGARFPSTASLEGTGVGEADGIGLDFLRRDFRAPDEVAQLGVDAATLDGSFPAAQNTTHTLRVVNDPDGAATALFVNPTGATSLTVTRLALLLATDGALPTRLRFELRALHDFEGDVGLESRSALTYDFDVTSALTGSFEFGALDTVEDSADYPVTATGSHSFTLSSAFASGDVQSRINGGTWSTFIAAGATSGSVSATVGDTLEVRHLSTDPGALKLLEMTAPASGQAAFAVLFV